MPPGIKAKMASGLAAAIRDSSAEQRTGGGRGYVLRFVHDREIEHNFIILRDHDCPRHHRD
jgi:hypothetical protein